MSGIGTIQFSTSTASARALAGFGRLDVAYSRASRNIASGKRIASSGDDPAGIVSSTLLNSKISTQSAAIERIQEALGLFRLADAGLDSIQEKLLLQLHNAIKILNSAGRSVSEEKSLAYEYISLGEDIYKLSQTVKFSKTNLLDGSLDVSKGLAVVLGDEPGKLMTVDIPDVGLYGLAPPSPLYGFVDAFTSQSQFATLFSPVISTLQDTYIPEVAAIRAQIGAQTKRLETTLDMLMENRARIISAKGRIQDADLALEMTRLTSVQILAQTNAAALLHSSDHLRGLIAVLREM